MLWIVLLDCFVGVNSYSTGYRFDCLKVFQSPHSANAKAFIRVLSYFVKSFGAVLEDDYDDESLFEDIRRSVRW